MDVHGHLCEQDDMKARMAVVVYHGKEGTLATINRVGRTESGGPVLLSGECLTHENLRALTERLTEKGRSRHLLPPEVLVADQDLLVWHTPAQRRPVFWETGTEVDRWSGKPALFPALLWIAGPKSLHLFALASDARPTADTPLYRAPVYNVYATGMMCPGTVRMPEFPVAEPEVIAGYETAFFCSSFVHTNLGGKDITNYWGGHAGLWKSLHATTHRFFPSWALVPLKESEAADARPLTLGKVLKRK